MENTTLILQSAENDNIRLSMYKNYFFGRAEVTVQITDADRPKYPQLFSISKVCELNEIDKTAKHLMNIIYSEYTETWEPIDKE